jgi:flagellar biosynthesis protein FlhF
METKTYRARSMQEALELIRRDLGPDAAVLHAREVRCGLLRWFGRDRQIEVTASATVNVPSRFPAGARRVPHPVAAATEPPSISPRRVNPSSRIRPELAEKVGAADTSCYPANQATTGRPPARFQQPPPAHEHDFVSQFRNDLKGQLGDLHSMMEDLCRKKDGSATREMPECLFRLFTDLIDAEVSEELARELVERVRSGATGRDLDDVVLLKARIARMVEDEIEVCGPIQITPGRRRLVALVGPTGVGKTTTIAKLAANFRLRERHRVGLITVDTYRIAAVEQLRTYADIIDLPMEVVSTPRQMREAVARLANLDLILLDTAGRSPRDEVKIQELKSMLAEAQADEVHLVLSSVASTEALKKTAKSFSEVGADALVLTKLDESTGLGNLIPLLRACKLPLRYLTDGQNVPDDIEVADRRRLARIVLGMESYA